MKKFLALGVFLVVFSFGVYAQNDAPKQINGGVLNGKATYLAKPPYPAAARAVKASGSVSVQVLIDEEGKVVSASAISGHPLLQSAAVKAALESKFAPTTLSGQAVKVSGIITYNFVGPQPSKSNSEIGFDLGLLEKSKDFPNEVSIYSISASLPEDWNDEREKMKEYYDTPKFSVREEKPAPDSDPKNASANTVKGEVTDLVSANHSTGLKVVRADEFRAASVMYSAQRPKISTELIEKIESRLSSNQNLLWKFKVGVALGRIAAQDDLTNIRNESVLLNDLVTSAPNMVVSPDKLENLKKLVELIQTSDGSKQSIAMIEATAKRLKIL